MSVGAVRSLSHFDDIRGWSSHCLASVLPHHGMFRLHASVISQEIQCIQPLEGHDIWNCVFQLCLQQSEDRHFFKWLICACCVPRTECISLQRSVTTYCLYYKTNIPPCWSYLKQKMLNENKYNVGNIKVLFFDFLCHCFLKLHPRHHDLPEIRQTFLLSLNSILSQK